MPRDEPVPASVVAPRWRWVAVTTLAGYWLAMAVLLHVPPVFPPVPRKYPVDKLVHAGLYFGLTLLLAWTVLGFRRRSGESPRTQVLAAAGWAVAVAMVYGVVDEWTQPLTGRQFEWLDLVADDVGIVAGAVAFGAVARLFMRGHATGPVTDSS